MLSARRLPEADKALYLLVVDVGRISAEPRTLISEITGLAAPAEELPGRLVVVACGIASRLILGSLSEGVLLTTYTDPVSKLGSIPLPAPAGVPVGSPVR